METNFLHLIRLFHGCNSKVLMRRTIYRYIFNFPTIKYLFQTKRMLRRCFSNEQDLISHVSLSQHSCIYSIISAFRINMSSIVTKDYSIITNKISISCRCERQINAFMTLHICDDMYRHAHNRSRVILKEKQRTTMTYMNSLKLCRCHCFG